MPYNHLRDLWNEMIRRGHVANGDGGRAAGLLARLRNMVWHYPDLTFANADRDLLIQLIDDIRFGNVRHDAGANGTPDGWDNFAQLYAWIPGNLFIGPSNRADDPGEDFDTPALVVVGSPTYNRLQTVDNAITSYVNSGNGQDAARATVNLNQVARRQTYDDLNPQDWVLVNTTAIKYRVRTQSQMQVAAAG